MLKKYKFVLQGLGCPNCAKKIENKVASIDEYKDVIVNFSTLTLSLKTDKENGVEEEVKKIVKSIEADVKVVSNDEKNVEVVQRNNKDIIRLAIGVIIYLLGTICRVEGIIMTSLTIISVIVLTIKTAKKAFKQLKNKIGTYINRDYFYATCVFVFVKQLIPSTAVYRCFFVCSRTGEQWKKRKRYYYY